MEESAFKSLLNTADGFVIYRICVDPSLPASGEVEFVSASLLQVMGISPDSPFSGWFEGIHESDAERVREENARSASKGLRFDQTFRTWHEPLKQWRWIHAVSDAVRNEAGEVTNFNGMLVDVTDQKEAEEKAMELRDRLQESLRLEALGLLAGGIAHDFNNLLMVIGGSTSLLRESLASGDSQSSKKRVNVIEEQVGRASELTAQLLGYARSGSFEEEYVDLAQVVGSVADTLSRTHKAIRIDTRRQPGAWVNANSAQVERIFINLILNAIDAVDPQSGYIEITLVRGQPGGQHTVHVADNGHGIDHEHLPRIFDPFYTTKGPGVGTGLGLSASQGIAESLRGSLSVSTRPGKGSTFTVMLPAVEPHEPIEMNEPAPDALTAQTILVIDDEEAVRSTIAEMLRHLGNEVFTAGNAHTAESVVRERNFDLFFLDLIMPGMSGAPLARHLHQVAGRSIPFIILSGYASESESREAIKAGAQAFLRKPVRLDDLRDALVQSLHRGSAEAPAVTSRDS